MKRVRDVVEEIAGKPRREHARGSRGPKRINIPRQPTKRCPKCADRVRINSSYACHKLQTYWVECFTCGPISKRSTSRDLLTKEWSDGETNPSVDAKVC